MKVIKRFFIRKKNYLAITGIIIASLIPLGAGENYFEVSKNMEILSDIYKELNIYYVDEVNSNELMRQGIDAMLQSLDPYTNYYSEAELENYRFQTTGKYGGIGAIIRKRDDHIIVIEPYEKSPAQKAGLQAGDYILEVNGKSTKDRSVAEISKFLKGSPGTQMELLIQRYGETGTRIINLDRDEVKMESVPYYGMVNENIGYIRLTQFTQRAGKEVEKAFLNLKKNNDLKSVILDLRGNPGGLLHEAVNISNIFIEKNQLVVSTLGKVKEWDRDFKTLNKPQDLEIPLIVLINNSSASASEIVAGTIQDYDRGVVLGTRSYGKGLVQQTRNISYNTKLKLTTAKYYIPSGRCIQAIDYSLRNEEGGIAEIPDSLKTPFKTKGGRQVFDGGGIEPDIEVKGHEISKVSISLLTKDLIFDYATQYHYEHDSILSAIDFKLSEQDFEMFLKYISDKDYDYVTRSEKILEKLEENSKEEKYYNAIGTSLDELKTKIQHDKEKDIQRHKEEITEILEREITGRYYYQSGQLEASFDDDLMLQKAIQILSGSGTYQKAIGLAN